MPLTVDAAIGGPWETIGNLIKRFNGEDSSGFRRALSQSLATNNYNRFHGWLPIAREEFDAIRNECIEAWGEPK